MGEPEEGASKPRWLEPVMWSACLVVAVVPTVMATSALDTVLGVRSPLVGFGLYVAAFTVAVLAMKPWSFR